MSKNDLTTINGFSSVLKNYERSIAQLLQEKYGIGVLFDETNPKDIAKVINGFVIDEAQMAECANNCGLLSRLV